MKKTILMPLMMIPVISFAEVKSVGTWVDSSHFIGAKATFTMPHTLLQADANLKFPEADQHFDFFYNPKNVSRKTISDANSECVIERDSQNPVAKVEISSSSAWTVKEAYGPKGFDTKSELNARAGRKVLNLFGREWSPIGSKKLPQAATEKDLLALDAYRNPVESMDTYSRYMFEANKPLALVLTHPKKGWILIRCHAKSLSTNPNKIEPKTITMDDQPEQAVARYYHLLTMKGGILVDDKDGRELKSFWPQAVNPSSGQLEPRKEAYAH